MARHKGTRPHATREQPMDTGPKEVNLLITGIKKDATSVSVYDQYKIGVI